MGFLGVYGHVNVDYILLLPELPGVGTTVPVRQTLRRLGGTAGNIARSAAAQGVPTSLAACVGDDFPREFRDSLEASGIDLTDLKHVAGGTPTIWILSVADGPHSAVIDQGVMGDGVARPKLDFAWLNSDWVHLTTGDPKEWLATARAAGAAGKRITFDPAQELSYRYPGRLFEELLNTSDLFICNEPELPRALDLLGYADLHQLFDHTERVVVTMGAKGVRVVSPKEDLRLPACPVRGVDAVEATGAGDAFRGGLYAALFRKRGWDEAVRAASASASLYLEQRGERFPTWDDVTARLGEWMT